MQSTTDQLRELARLLSDGHISQEIFDRLKDQVLAANLLLDRSAESMSLSGAPTSIGAYSLFESLGEGGQATVYRGRHRSVERARRQGGDIAVKIMHARFATNATYRARFEREADLGLKLEHPGIVDVFDLLIDGNLLALVMELVPGHPLKREVGEVSGPIPVKRALTMFQQLLDAVGHAHAEGVVHRDLKPDNVMVQPDGRVKVLDFGIAKVGLANPEESKITRTKTGMGTIDYMAPEQYTSAAEVDNRADIYALGMTLYHMLAGRLPWAPEATEFSVMEMKITGKLEPPTAFYPDIPPEVVEAVHQALSVEPEQRFQDTAAFASALARWQSTTPSGTLPSQPTIEPIEPDPSLVKKVEDVPEQEPEELEEPEDGIDTEPVQEVEKSASGQDDPEPDTAPEPDDVKVADHLIWNLVNLLFCLGGVLPPAVGIYFSLEVSKARRRGDRKAAERASGLAAGAAILGTLGGLALLGFATLVLLAGMGA